MPDKLSKKTGRTVLLIVFCAVIVSPILAIDWSEQSGLDWVVNFGRIAGLMSFAILGMQGILTCRLKLLDRLFAIDKVTNFHKRMGIFVTCLLIAHVGLIIAGKQNLAILSMDTGWQVNFGKAGIALLLITVTLALAFEAFGIDYNVWRMSHKSAWSIVVLAFAHSLFIGRELLNGDLVFAWWILLTAAATACCYRNIYIPFFARYRYLIKSVTRQTHNTYTLTLEPAEGAIKEHKPGQFSFLKLERRGRKSEIHPFTIASSPTTQPQLQFTIKKSGNYTNTIDQTTTSDTALVEGPYGQFSVVNYPAGQILFIAGGVGITPVMSMIRYLRDTKDSRQVVFLYGNRTPGDIIFEEELRTLPDNFRVTHVLSQADSEWAGLKGHITKEIIAEYAGSVLGRAEVFLCGPPPMMDKIVVYLRELDVSHGRIHYERFTI